MTFRWRDKDGNRHDPRNMETRHLFYTLKMLWNHSVPKEHQLKPFKQYALSEFYNFDYRAEAIDSFLVELDIRTDIMLYMKKDLARMKKVFNETNSLRSFYGLLHLNMNESEAFDILGIEKDV